MCARWRPSHHPASRSGWRAIPGWRNRSTPISAHGLAGREGGEPRGAGRANIGSLATVKVHDPGHRRRVATVASLRSARFQATGLVECRAAWRVFSHACVVIGKLMSWRKGNDCLDPLVLFRCSKASRAARPGGTRSRSAKNTSRWLERTCIVMLPTQG